MLGPGASPGLCLPLSPRLGVGFFCFLVFVFFSPETSSLAWMGGIQEPLVPRSLPTHGHFLARREGGREGGDPGGAGLACGNCSFLTPRVSSCITQQALASRGWGREICCSFSGLATFPGRAPARERGRWRLRLGWGPIRDPRAAAQPCLGAGLMKCRRLLVAFIRGSCLSRLSPSLLSSELVNPSRPAFSAPCIDQSSPPLSTLLHLYPPREFTPRDHLGISQHVTPHELSLATLQGGVGMSCSPGGKGRGDLWRHRPREIRGWS